MSNSDGKFFNQMKDVLNVTFLISFETLFSNLENNLEIANTVLDLIFLIGDPIRSTTYFDYPDNDLCHFGCPFTEKPNK